MTFLEALYGSQYYELNQKGRDGNKGRGTANILLSVIIMLGLFAVILLAITVYPEFNNDMARVIKSIFGRLSGRSIGKLIALPVIGLIYLVVVFTIGNKNNFKKHVAAFLLLPDGEKKKANKKLLTPFFILLAAVLILSILQL